jgi:hypothetical protein
VAGDGVEPSRRRCGNHQEDEMNEHDHGSNAPQHEDATTPTSRRAMLRRAAVGAAAAGVATVATSGRTALAADPDDLSLLIVNEHSTRTGARYLGTAAPTAFNVESGAFDATNDTILGTVLANGGTAFLGVANAAGTQQVGVVGWSRKALGTGVVGFTGGTGSYGGEFFGGLAEVRLRPGGAAPITLTNAHQAGELYEDETGVLWLCVAAGAPGTWRELGGTTSAGAFHPIAPQRVFDSRTTLKLAAAEERVVPVTTSITGAADVVPAGATAVACTVTVTQTEQQGGFVSIRPDGTADNGTSSINWWGPGQTLATTVISGLGGDRRLLAKTGPAATHLLVDITGYYR